MIGTPADHIVIPRLKKHFPFLISAGWFPSLIFGIHCILSLGFKAYDRVPLLDIPMHILGGVAIAYFFHAVLDHLDGLGLARVGSRTATLIMVFGLVASATVAWELAEFLADLFFHVGAQRGLADTMKDEFMGLVGGLAYIGLFSRSVLTRQLPAATQPDRLVEAASSREALKRSPKP